MPPWLESRLGGLAPALLAALVASQLSAPRSMLPALDARLAGVAVATGLAVLRAPLVACVAAGALTAAACRLLGMP
jgi:branched-subunit amino acid transport protein